MAGTLTAPSPNVTTSTNDTANDVAMDVTVEVYVRQNGRLWLSGTYNDAVTSQLLSEFSCKVNDIISGL